MSISLSHVSVASCCSTFSPEKLDVVAGVILTDVPRVDRPIPGC